MSQDDYPLSRGTGGLSPQVEGLENELLVNPVGDAIKGLSEGENWGVRVVNGHSEAGRGIY